MAAPDISSILLQMRQEMKKQRRVDLKKFQDVFVTKQRHRRDIQGIHLVFCTPQNTAATITSTDRFSLAKRHHDG